MVDGQTDETTDPQINSGNAVKTSNAKRQRHIAHVQAVERNDHNDTTEFINQTVNIYDISQQILHYR